MNHILFYVRGLLLYLFFKNQNIYGLNEDFRYYFMPVGCQ